MAKVRFQKLEDKCKFHGTKSRDLYADQGSKGCGFETSGVHTIIKLK